MARSQSQSREALEDLRAGSKDGNPGAPDRPSGPRHRLQLHQPEPLHPAAKRPEALLLGHQTEAGRLHRPALHHLHGREPGDKAVGRDRNLWRETGREHRPGNREGLPRRGHDQGQRPGLQDRDARPRRDDRRRAEHRHRGPRQDQCHHGPAD